MKLQLLSVVILLLAQEISCYFYPKYKNDWNLTYDPDMFRNVSQLITSKGYPAEVHTVQTADGYLLSVQRIPHGKNKLHSGKKPPVLLQHGLLSAASDFVFNFPEQSLGFILADNGYDVWLGNTRGNTYSRRHIKLDPTMKAFWNYSFDQMAEYDLPAMIDYVLNKTEQKQLIYIGHSQGTTSAFALLSQSPLYNEKIKLFVGLAPVATVGYISSGIKYFAPFVKELDFIFSILGVKDFLPNNAIIKYLSEKACATKLSFLCEDIIFLLCGWDEKQLNVTRLPVYTTHSPAGTSTKSLVHYAQMVVSKKFQKYDYGKDNHYHYNQDTPPEYNISKITTPIALIWSTNDYFADIIDLSLLERKLNSVVESYCVHDREFNHYDFVVAVEARKLVYEELLTLLQKYVSE